MQLGSDCTGYYRYDDIDAGIIKHSTWIIDTAKKLNADQRKKYGPAMTNAYINLAEAWAGRRAGHGRAGG